MRLGRAPSVGLKVPSISYSPGPGVGSVGMVDCCRSDSGVFTPPKVRISPLPRLTASAPNHKSCRAEVLCGVVPGSRVASCSAAPALVPVGET